MKIHSLALLTFIAPTTATWWWWGDKDKEEEPKEEETEEEGTCPTYEIDFEGFHRGDYITDQLEEDFGVTIECSNNDHKSQYGCRIFDTAVPVGNWPGSSCHDCGDKDLGSPNRYCIGGGPGRGYGGAPHKPYPNCDPLGGVLIIDENGPHYPPDDSISGGKINFTFEHPVKMEEMCFLDVDHDGKYLNGRTKIKVYTADGGMTTDTVPLLGDNGAGCVSLPYNDVTNILVEMSLGAITSLKYKRCNVNGGGGGDPHIERWGQESVFFHGECDLVMLHSDRYGHHGGLDLHIRTKIYEFYSYIESAALRMGHYLLHVEQDGLTLDSKAYSYDDLPLSFGHGDTHYKIELLVNDEEQTKIRVLLHDTSEIFFTFYKHFLHILVSGNSKDFGDSVGLLGKFGSGDMIARGGALMENMEDFAHSWQVHPDTDGQLFKEIRAPQFPEETCRMPTVEAPSRRRLRADTALYNQAKEACEQKAGAHVQACIEDVMATGDVGLANIW